LDAGIPEGQVLMEIGEKLLQDTPPTGLEDAAAILKNKMAASEAYLESGIEGYSSETLPDLLANITADAASVEEAQAAIDEIKPGVPGDNFMLTANGDVLEGTANNDTFTATDTTYSAGDVILGGSGNDTLTIEAAANNAAPAATVAGVENVVFNAKSFTNLTFDAANVVGQNATITFNNTQTAGATGGTVSNVGSGATVVAGSQVTGTFAADLTSTASGVTVNGANAGTVNVTDAGKEGVTVVSDKVGTTTTAVNISVDGDGDATAGTANDAATVKAKGIVALETAATNQVENLTLEGNGQAVTFNLNATGDAPEIITFAGDQDVTLTGAAAQFATETATDSTTAGTTTIKINDGASANFEKLAVDVIEIADEAAALATYNVADNANVKLTTEDLTANGNLVFDSTVAANTDTAETLNLEIDDAAVLTANALVTSDFETLNLSTSDASATAGDSAVVIGNLTASTGTNAVVNITGDTDLTLTAVTAKKIAAGGFTGKLAATLSANMADITTGTGDDTLTAYDGSFTVAAGAGNDTLNVADTLDLSDDTISLSGIETISIDSDGDNGGETLKVKSSFIDGTGYIIKGSAGTADTLDVVMDSASVNLSNLVVDSSSANVTVTNTAVNGIAQTIEGSNGADTLTSVGTGAVTMNGNAGDDVITTAGGNDVINGGAGSDRLVTGAGNDSVTGGEGADHIIAGAGGDTIDLTETTSAQDAVVFAALTDGSAAGQAAGTFTGFDVITGFTSGTDDLIFDSAYAYNNAVTGDIVNGNVTVVAGTAATNAANDLTASDVTNVDKVAKFLSDGAYTTSTATQDDIVAITFDDFTAVYAVTDAVVGGAIEAGEIKMIGTVDETLVSVDIIA
jgi:hypothetical protein